MALTLLGRRSIIDHIGTAFVKMRVGGSWQKDAIGNTGWVTAATVYSGSISKDNGTVSEAGAIYFNTPVVFQIDLAESKTVTYDNTPGFLAVDNFTRVNIEYVELLDAANVVVLKKVFPAPGPYIYLGNGTFTVNSLVIYVSS